MFRINGRVAATIGVAAMACAMLLGQSPDERLAWNEPVEPFRVIGHVHYVGAAGVSAFLMTTSDGSVLLDGGLPETASQIIANVAKLGFNIKDVKYLLNSHAHFDHAGGLAELKRVSGATLVASSGDAPALKAGSANMPAVVVDRVIADGETVRLGEVTLRAVLTPGHTKGCTTWTMTTTEGGRPHTVLFYCSTSVVDRLIGNTEYPDIAEDYKRTFERLRGLKADVFLANHPVFFEMHDKRKRTGSSNVNPFVDPGELQRFVASSERAFFAALTSARE